MFAKIHFDGGSKWGITSKKSKKFERCVCSVPQKNTTAIFDMITFGSFLIKQRGKDYLHFACKGEGGCFHVLST